MSPCSTSSGYRNRPDSPPGLGTRRAQRCCARSAVDTVIAGLYCLSVPGTAERYDAGAGKDLKKLLAQFVTAADVGTEVLDDMLAFLGPGSLPLRATMVSDIAANNGPAAAQDLPALLRPAVGHVRPRRPASAAASRAPPVQ